MVFKILFSYIIGYLNIEVEGVFIERFINICKAKNIILWNIKIKEEIKLYTNIGTKDFKHIREVARRTNSNIKIRKKCGIPFIFNRYKKRKVLGIFFILIILTIIILSNFIWNISVTGNNDLATQDIIDELKKDGLQIGTLKRNINLNKVINNVRLNNNDIAWIGISIKGTNAIVKIKERKKAPRIINENEYCNIISDKDGIITEINVQNGTANVKEGDIVKKGDILVNGYMEGKYMGVRYVHAVSDIKAKVWYSKKIRAYLNQQIPTPTGKTETKYSIKINNFKINFYKTLSKFQNYDKISKSKKLKLFYNFYLPIEIIKTTNKEMTIQDVTYTKEELEKRTVKKIEEELKNQILNKENIVNEQINKYESHEKEIEGNDNKDYIDIEVIFEVLDNIGIEERIVF